MFSLLWYVLWLERGMLGGEVTLPLCLTMCHLKSGKVAGFVHHCTSLSHVPHRVLYAGLLSLVSFLFFFLFNYGVHLAVFLLHRNMTSLLRSHELTTGLGLGRRPFLNHTEQPSLLESHLFLDRTIKQICLSPAEYCGNMCVCACLFVCV